MIKISPSVLASDFSRLGDEAKKAENGGADMLHLDVMDGHFVPNISFGAPVIASIRDKTSLFFDVHLMISDPLKYAGDFAKAGADMIVFHIESDSDTDETLDRIHALGCKAGIAIKPATPAEEVIPYIRKADMILVMTVEPGFGGQSFMPETMPKVSLIRQVAAALGKDLDIQVDGGINYETVVTAAAAGANVFVAGSAVFRSPDPAAAIGTLKRNAEVKSIG
ncbi:MAG: ribulose-phosphate 3-epimerase [Clostridia bacterium]|nr:ribulose-phosphate 3-epimerase [Clostridia bacterium]